MHPFRDRCAGLLMTAASFVSAGGASSSAQAREPVALIFDTDIGNDVDDVL
jgi:hypothetical protein